MQPADEEEETRIVETFFRNVTARRAFRAGWWAMNYMHRSDFDYNSRPRYGRGYDVWYDCAVDLRWALAEKGSKAKKAELSVSAMAS